MAKKVKIGMLCTFKSRNKDMWEGHKTAPGKEYRKSFFDKAHVPVRLGKPFVTVLEKKAGKYLTIWMSYSKVLGVLETGELVKVWVRSDSIKPVKSPQ